MLPSGSVTTIASAAWSMAVASRARSDCASWIAVTSSATTTAPRTPPRFVPQRRDEQLEVAGRAVAARVADRHRDEGVAGHHLGEAPGDPGGVVGTEDRRGTAQDLGLAPAEHVLGRRAPGRDEPVEVDGDDGKRAGPEDGGRRPDGGHALALRARQQVVTRCEDPPQGDRRDHHEADPLDGSHQLARAAREQGAHEDVGEQDPGDPHDGVAANDESGGRLPAAAGASCRCRIVDLVVRHRHPRGHGVPPQRMLATAARAAAYPNGPPAR